MTTFEAYKIYLALRLHFTTDSYDITKTKGRIKASEKSLQKNIKLQYHLQKIKKKYSETEFINFLVANFISGDKWGGTYSFDAEEKYLQWQKIQDSLSYIYTQDLQHIADSSNINKLSELWDCKEGHPLLLKKYFGKTCHLETLVILNKLFKFIDVVDEQLVFDPVWNTVSKLIYKYSPFIKIDKEKYTHMTSKVFSL